jgi:hypothetical protein
MRNGSPHRYVSSTSQYYLSTLSLFWLLSHSCITSLLNRSCTNQWLQSAVFASYSILPTFLAIGVGLMWDAIEKTSRRLLPFLSMSNKPTPLNIGSCLTYQSSFLGWATLKALSHRHWLLAMVSAGSVVCQICKSSILMSWIFLT